MKTTGILYTDVKIGDRLSFETRDTGFGGAGLVYRVGKVTKVTEKSIALACDHNTTARIRRTDFSQRCLGKVVGD